MTDTAPTGSQNSSSVDVVEKLLLDLHASIDAHDSYADCGAIVSSIEAIVLGEVEDIEADLFADLLCHSRNPPSLVEYVVLTTRVKDREVIRSKVSALKLLARFIKTFGSAVEPFSVHLAVTLIDTFKKEESGEVKAALLLPLKNVFRSQIPRSELSDKDDLVFQTELIDPATVNLQNFYSSLLGEVKYNKKITKGVLCESLKLFGILVAAYSAEEATLQNVDNIIIVCNQTLRDNFKPSCKDPDFPAIAGCFSCLDRIFFQYEEKCENNSELWKYLLQTIQTVNSPDVSKYAAAGKAVRFVKNHAELFVDLIGLNAEQSYAILIAAHRSDKTAVSKHSADAVSSLMMQMANFLSKETKKFDSIASLKEQSKIHDALKTVTGLVDQYLAVLKDAKFADKEDVYHALKGVMSVASSFSRLFLLSDGNKQYSPSNVMETLIKSAKHEELVSSVAKAAFTEEDETPTASLSQMSVYKKSLYLGAVVSILFALFVEAVEDEKQIGAFSQQIASPALQEFLDEYVTVVVIGYVRLWRKMQLQVQSTLVKALYLCLHGTFKGCSHETIIPLNMLRNTLFRTLLMRTSARKESNEQLNVASARISEYTGEMDDRLLHGYMSLWTELSRSSDKALKTQLISLFGPSVLEHCTKRVLEITWQHVLDTVKELNLSYIRAEEFELNGVAFMPCNIVDQDLLISLVEFFSAFVKQYSPSLVRSFFDCFIEEIIALSVAHPLVSSFYKLMVTVVSHLHDVLLSEGGGDTVRSLAQFVLDLQGVVQSNQTDFQGELLDASLGLILSIPITIVPLHKVMPSLTQSIKTGSNVLLAVQQLNRAVVKDFPSASRHLPELVPMLGSYLERFAQVAASNAGVRSASSDGGGGNESENKALQDALLELLGRIGGMNKLLLQDPSQAVEDSLSWSVSPLVDISVSVPVDPALAGELAMSTQSSTRLNLSLDTLLILLTNLCQRLLLSGKDDQLLISSAEVFHTLMIVLLGNASGANAHSEYASSFKRTFPVVIKLGAKQLKCKPMFELMLFQCVHWFSSAANAHEEDASALIEIMFDALCDNNSDSAERDLAARGLEEYFVWSIKQTEGEVRSSARINNFLSKIVTLLSHPLSNFRKGSVVVLGKIYKSFREENVLVSKHGMKFLTLLLNTTLLDNSGETFKEHERLIFKYEEILAIAISRRGWLDDLVSPLEDRSNPADLKELVSWLWEGVLSPADKCFRRCCMRCFATLAPLLQTVQHDEAVRATRSLITQWAATEGSDNVVASIDNAVESKTGCSEQQKLSAMLDIYTWLHTMQFVSPRELCDMSKATPTRANSVASRSARFFSALSHNTAKEESGAPMHDEKSVQVTYRFVIWLQALLSRSEDSSHPNVIFFLRKSGLWCEQVFRGILRSLDVLKSRDKASHASVSPSSTSSAQNEIVLEDFAGALRHLLRFLPKFEAETPDSVVCIVLREYLEREWNDVLREDVSVARLSHARAIFSISSSNTIDAIVYGAFCEDLKLQLTAVLLKRVRALCENSESSLGDGRLCVLFKLCVDLGLQWDAPSTSLLSPSLFRLSLPALSALDSSSELALLQLLRTDAGTLLLSALDRDIVSAMLRRDSSLSLWTASNVALLVQHVDFPAVATLWEAVLVKLSARLCRETDHHCAELYATCVLPQLQTSRAGLLGLPESLLDLLVVIDAEAVVVRGDGPAHLAFRRALAQDCCAKFNAANKVAVSTLQVRLRWIPFLLRGTLSHAPRAWMSSCAAAEEAKLEADLLESFECFVSLKFPLDSKELNPATEQGKEYLSLLDGYLRAFEQCGAVVLLKPLLPSFRECEQHRYFARLQTAVASVAAKVTCPLDASCGGTNVNTNTNTDLEEVRQLCNFCVDLLLDPYQDFVIKRFFFDNLFLPAISRMSSQLVARLFSTLGALNLQSLGSSSSSSSSLVKTMYDVVCKDHLAPGAAMGQDEHETSANLYLQIACFKIFGFLFDHCALNDLKGGITQAFVGSETVSGKELTQSLCKIAFKVAKSSAFCDERFRNLVLELQASAYECLAITVSKTQSDEQFFDTFLFKVKPGEDLWTRVTHSPALGDALATLFTVVSGTFPTRRLGWERSAAEQSAEDPRAAKLRKISMRTKLGVKGGFLSQFLKNSMLSSSSVSQSQSVSALADETQSDANLGNYSQSQYLSDDAAAPTPAGLRSYDVSSADDAVVAGWDDVVVYLEMNHVNTVPVMGTIVRTIARMHKLFSAKWAAQGSAKLPFWLQEFRTRLSDRGCPQRVRLFVLRLLLNQPVTDIVVPWVGELLPAILDCALEDLCVSNAHSVSGNNLHYFLRDLVFALCDAWREGFSAMCCYQASKFLNFLLQNVLDEDGAVLKENTDSVCTLLRVWLGHDEGASSFNLSLAPLVQMLSAQGGATGGAHARRESRGSQAMRARLAGLEIVSTLLQCDYPLYCSSCEHAGALLAEILANVKFARKEVAESACVVSGALLAKKALLESKSRGYTLHSQMKTFHEQLLQAVEAQLTQKFGADLLASSIRNVTVSFPAFLSRELIMKTLHCFPQLKFRHRFHYLDALTRSPGVEGLQFTALLRPYLKSLLSEVTTTTYGRGSVSAKVPAVQVATILLLTKHREELSAELALQLVGENDADGLRLCVNSKSCVQVRDAAYQFLMALFVTIRKKRDTTKEKEKAADAMDEEGEGEDSLSVLEGAVCRLLLGGLTDADDAGMELDWASPHAVVHSLEHYENPHYWTSSGSGAARVGVRRRLLEFFNYEVGLSASLSTRLLALLSRDLLDPLHAEAWLKYASYFALLVVLSSGNGGAADTLLFARPLGGENHALSGRSKDVLSAAQFVDTASVSSSTPMFALERTTQCLSQLMHATGSQAVAASAASQAALKSVFSQSNIHATQSFMQRKSGGGNGGAKSDGSGIIRGTQQLAWTQTQANLLASQQGGGGGAGAARSLNSGGADGRSGAPGFGTYKWTQSQALDAAPRDSSQLTQNMNMQDNNAPAARERVVVTQRVPARINASMLDKEKSKNYALFRKVQVAKKLRGEEERLRRRRVTFFRRYRTGELPDICISVVDLLAPLTSLCLQHSGVSEQVLCTLFSALHDSEEFQAQAVAAIAALLPRLKGGAVSSLFASFLLKEMNALLVSSPESCRAVSALVADEPLVAALARESGNMYLGVNILEDALSRFAIVGGAQNGALSRTNSVSGATTASASSSASAAAESQATKRGRSARSSARTTLSAATDDSDAIANDLFDNSRRGARGAASSSSSTTTATLQLAKSQMSSLWSQVLRLYDELQESDVMVSLTVKCLADQRKAQSLKSALDAELRGEYLEAIDIYLGLLEERREPAATSSSNSRKRNAAEMDENAASEEQTAAALEKQLWFDRGLSCLERLSDWEKMRDYLCKHSEIELFLAQQCVSDAPQSSKRRGRAARITTTDESVHAKQQLIPQYFRATLQCLSDDELLGGGGGGAESAAPPSLSFVEQLLSSNGPARAWVERSCSAELLTYFVLRKDWQRARLFSEQAQKQFLLRWNTLRPCAAKARQKLLLELEPLLELRDVVSVNLDRSLSQEHLVRLWASSEPSLLDPLPRWTELALTRRCGLSSLSRPAALHLAHFHVRAAVASVQQGVLSMVKPLLQKNSALRKAAAVGAKMELSLDEVHVVSQYNRVSILRNALGSAQIPGMLAKAKGLLSSKMKLLGEDASSSSSLERFQVTLMQADWQAFAAKYEQDLVRAGGALGSTLAAERRDAVLENKLAAMTSYLAATRMLSSGTSSFTAEPRHRELCFSTVARYCDQLLGELESDAVHITPAQAQDLQARAQPLLLDRDLSSLSSATELVALLATHMLVAGLQCGSAYCSERILRLVAIVGKYPALLEKHFESALERIPAWVFLRYSAQMQGSLDRPEGRIVARILQRVAGEYPQALLYSFRITAENFGAQGRALTGALERTLANPHVDALIEALTGLTHPELRWSDGMKEIESRLKTYFSSDGSLSARDKAELGKSIVAHFQAFKKNTLEASWAHIGAKMGKYNAKWAKQMKAEVQSILGGKDDKLLSGKTVFDKLKALSSKSDPALGSGKVALGEFSQWLLDYSDISGSRFRLEIPGQYAQYIKSRPAPETHELVSSFDPRVLVMTSIRKPKRVKIYGHMGSETFFLVKGGEDLRNDERIEQLFMLMNHVIDEKMQSALNPSLFAELGVGRRTVEEESEETPVSPAKAPTRSFLHGYAARTYTVVPMSSKVGVLEWVKNTVPLKTILCEELARDQDFLHANPNCLESNTSVDLTRIAAYQERLTWVSGHQATDYHKMFKKASRDQAFKVFASVTSKVPSDLLKRYFRRLSLNAEAFCTLRSEFAKSLAISNVFGYVLGLGDRHLDNLLIDTRTGSVVQIDFGICFGIGSSMLPVPELIPFRLTPSLRDAVQPLDGLALTRQFMAKVMRFLRDDATGGSDASFAGVIGNALEIYINDPVIDWLRGISATDKDELESLRVAAESSGKMEWEPTRRVRMAIRKLKGEDPVGLMLEDLRSNAAVTKLDTFESLKKILQAVRSSATKGGGGGGSGGLGDSTSAVSWGESMQGGSLPTLDATGSSAVKGADRPAVLSVQEQVDVLIKLATDADVLARQWAGLQTWM